MHYPENNQKDQIGETGVVALIKLLNLQGVPFFKVEENSDYGLDIIAYLPVPYVENEDMEKNLTERLHRRLGLEISLGNDRDRSQPEVRWGDPAHCCYSG